MSDAVSALGGAARSAGLAVAIAEIEGCGMIAVRGAFSDAAAAEALARGTGVDWPAPRRIARRGDRTMVWMSPDEGLLHLPRCEVAATLAALEAALAGLHHLALDVSDARAVFRLTGDGAAQAIAKGAPVDLSAAAFLTGDARRTHLGQVAAAFWRLEDAPETFELVCARSVAGYVFDWLCASAGEGTLPGWR